MHCCMPHFLTSSPILRLLGGNHPTDQNIEFLGTQHPECLKKRFPCSSYLNYLDYDYVSWVSEKFSDILAGQEGITRLTQDEMKSATEDCLHVHGSLKRGETWAEAESIISRILKENGVNLGEPRGPLNHRPEERLPPKIMETMWVYAINRKWNRVELMEEFRGEGGFQLITLADTNMLRMSDEEIKKGILFKRVRQRPTNSPNLTDSQFFNAQTYIYRCLDGYFEFEYSPTSGLFPFSNPPDEYESILTSDRQEYISILCQYVSSGQLELPADAEAGDRILDFLFRPAFIDQCMQSDDEASEFSEESVCSPKRIAREIRSRFLAREPPVRNIRARQSGVTGICWKRQSDRLAGGVCRH